MLPFEGAWYAAPDPARLMSAGVLTLQRLAGNGAVERLLARPFAPRVQRSALTVGAAHDAYAQEADRVAEQVLSMPDRPGPATPARPLQQGPQRREEEEVRLKALEPLGIFETTTGKQQRLNASRGGGAPLPGDARAYMEPRFAADFRGLRVHACGEAGQLNREISAQAFRHGPAEATADHQGHSERKTSRLPKIASPCGPWAEDSQQPSDRKDRHGSNCVVLVPHRDSQPVMSIHIRPWTVTVLITSGF